MVATAETKCDISMQHAFAGKRRRHAVKGLLAVLAVDAFPMMTRVPSLKPGNVGQLGRHRWRQNGTSCGWPQI